MPTSNIVDDEDMSAVIRPYQLVAASSPGRSTSDLIGNFGDIDDLFDQLSQPAVIELGKPLPKSKYLPKKRIGSCPAAHNEALISNNRS